MSVSIDMGDLKKIIEPGRMANWLGLNFNCWLEQHKGCWKSDPQAPAYACSCECHP